MSRAAQIASIMPRPDFRSRMDKADALNQDIIAVIHKNYPFAVGQLRGAAQKFKGDSVLDTASNIWTFLKKEITYKADPQGHQQVRLPSRFIADKTGDCKSYSLFTAGVLSNLGLPVKFRYANYNGTTIPTHVYVTTLDEDGNEVIIDGVWKYFNNEKPYTFKKDYTMRVSTLSGIGKAKNKKGGLFKKIGAGLKKAGQAVAKGAKAAGKAVGKGAKAVAKGAKKVAFAPGRAAFLGLVLMNVRGFATQLSKKITEPRTKTMWEKLGGNFTKLKDAVAKGAKKKRILGIYGLDDIFVPIEGISEPVTAATALVTAAPIIAVVIKFLKGEGVKDGELDAALNQATKTLAANGETIPDNLAEYDVVDAEPGSNYKSAGGGSLLSGGNNKILLIGGAALVGFLLLKSKRK